jgi:iron(III) transport system substrate-binding protein
MDRRLFLKGLIAAGALSPLLAAGAPAGPLSVDALPRLSGPLTLYMGRGEGGFYEDLIGAVRGRSPDLDLAVRRGPSSALANQIAAEARAGVRRADLFWAIDSGAIGYVAANASPRPVPSAVGELVHPERRYARWVPISGRVRTVPYNTDRLDAGAIPKSIMDLAETRFTVGWAPAYGAFQSFVTAMRLLEGEAATREWLRAMEPRATSYAGELGVVMGVERGEVDLGLANHYYTLRLKQGRPDASVALAFTEDDAGVLLNASGVVMLSDRETPVDFVRHLLTREAQGYLAREAFEVPMVAGVEAPPGLPAPGAIRSPRVDLEALADLRPTLDLLRSTGVL